MSPILPRGAIETAAVIGAGTWGTALANYLARRDLDVRLWAYEPEVVEGIRRDHRNPVYLPGFDLSPRIRPTGEMEEAVDGASLLVFVVPSHVARGVLKRLSPSLRTPVPLVSATKGIENDTLMLPVEVMLDVLGDGWKDWVGSLSGPSFAREVVQGLPTAVSLAMGNEDLTTAVQAAISSHVLRIYSNPDLVGLQIGGAVKNVIAISAGISDGLGFGNSARAALITRGLAEMRRLGLSMGARAETFSGLSGLGDLVLTCTGDLSRNRTLGLRLGEGEKLEEILGRMRMVAEGVHTSEAMVKLAARQDVEMPICQQTYAIVHGGKNPHEAVRDLMSRELKDEVTDLPA